MAICKKYANQVYWKSLDAPGKNKADYCKEKNLIAFVDYRGIGSSTVDKNLYFRDSTGGLTEVSGVDFG